MSDFKQLLNTCPLIGVVQWIGVRPLHRMPVEQREAIDVSPESGIEQDHYSRINGNRQITLIQLEHLKVMEDLLGRDVFPAQLRRNLGVTGINVHALRKSRFLVGDVILEGTGDCHPCSRMEEILGHGGYHAMRGHGGITARILSAGRISLRDPVLLQPENDYEPQ
jgi:MOSC domain-containing protein YiiM